MKKLNIILLAVALQCATQAARAFTVDGIEYTPISDNEVELTDGYVGEDGALTIPSEVTYEGVTYTVTEIARNAFNGLRTSSRYLASVVIPGSVRKVNSHAFQSCRNLTDITIGSPDDTASEDTVVVCSEAFYSCRSLANLSI